MLGLRPSMAAFGGVGKAKGEPCEALAKQGAGLRKNKNKDTPVRARGVQMSFIILIY